MSQKRYPHWKRIHTHANWTGRLTTALRWLPSALWGSVKINNLHQLWAHGPIIWCENQVCKNVWSMYQTSWPWYKDIDIVIKVLIVALFAVSCVYAALQIAVSGETVAVGWTIFSLYIRAWCTQSWLDALSHNLMPLAITWCPQSWCLNWYQYLLTLFEICFWNKVEIALRPWWACGPVNLRMMACKIHIWNNLTVAWYNHICLVIKVLFAAVCCISAEYVSAVNYSPWITVTNYKFIMLFSVNYPIEFIWKCLKTSLCNACLRMRRFWNWCRAVEKMSVRIWKLDSRHTDYGKTRERETRL